MERLREILKKVAIDQYLVYGFFVSEIVPVLALLCLFCCNFAFHCLIVSDGASGFMATADAPARFNKLGFQACDAAPLLLSPNVLDRLHT